MDADMPIKKPSRSPGRPKLPDDQRKLSPLAWRPSSETRGNLEEAAEKSGRTLSQETEERVSRTFREDRYYGAELGALLRIMAAAEQLIERQTKQSMLDDIKTYLPVRIAWLDILTAHCPEPTKAQKNRFKELDNSNPGEPPEWPIVPGEILTLLTTPDNEVSRAEFERRISEYNAQIIEWKTGAEKYRKLLDRDKAEMLGWEDMGEKAAEEAEQFFPLPPRE